MFKRKNVVLTEREPRALQGRAPVRVQETIGTAHPSVRPSLVTSNPCVTSGSRSLDRALAHGGIPLGTLTLIEEYGTTDFASALLKSMSALAVSESRAGLQSQVVCVGIPDWLRRLPSVLLPKSSSRRSTTQEKQDKMKIAWRYAKYAGNTAIETASAYCPDVDFQSTMVPAPQASEAHYITSTALEELAGKLSSYLRTVPKSTLVRIIIPSFLHPAVYTAPESSAPQQLYPFFTLVKSAIAAHGNAVAVVALPLKLYPRSRSVVAGLELLCDTCIELEPYESGDENVQGFLHINRIAALTDRGEMVEQHGELSFKLGRRQFEVTPYAIPVEVSEKIAQRSESW